MIPLSTVSVPVNFTIMAVGGDQNVTNKTCNLEETPEWILTLVSVYVWIIAVLGIVFNIFVLMVFCLHKKACTVAEIYLGNLAAADLVLMCCLPFWAVYVAKNYNWPFGRFLCKVINLGLKMNMYCSIYFLVLVSVDRYVALVHPLTQERLRRPKYAKLGCVLVWAFGFIINIPIVIYRDVKSCDNTTVRCYLTYTLTHYYVFESLQAIFSFIIPICIISFCTVIIILTLKKRLTEEQNRRRTDNKATTLLRVVVVAFLICWVPHHLVRIVEMLNRAEVISVDNKILENIIQIVIYFAFFNSVLNPILYVLVGKHFRKKILEVFFQVSGGVTTLSTTSTRSNLLRSAKSENVSS